MSWTMMRRWIARPKANAGQNPPAKTTSSSAEALVTETKGEEEIREPRDGISESFDGARKLQRVRSWRRRALLRKGARIYSSIAWKRNFVSLAMLDEEGLVIGWYEHGIDKDIDERPRMDSHVSQLYTAEDVAQGIPVRELRSAMTHGESIQTGWRLGIDGVKFWATTTIRAVRLRDGRLQGFSHATDRVPAPWRNELVRAWQWTWPFLKMTKPESRRSARTRPRQHTPALTRRAGAALTAALVVSLTPSLLEAKSARNMPDNATASEYGSGWECAHGFQRVRDACAKVVVPTNGYLDASGNRWRCDRGYLSEGDGCTPIKLPANAYFDDSYGTGWRCERRYRERLGACALIEVPANAHETDSSYGSGWECNHGYIPMSGGCQQVRVPANAYLAGSGDEWKCDRGFTRMKDSCVAIQVPPHGYLDRHGNDWSCNRGFRKTASECASINVPPNAHLDYTGDRWSCNRGFNEGNASCTKG